MLVENGIGILNVDVRENSGRKMEREWEYKKGQVLFYDGRVVNGKKISE